MDNIFFLYYGGKMQLKVKEIMKRIQENGYECYIVGGYVRDYLLGIDSNDYDLCTNAHPDVLKELFSTYKLLQHYGTITLLFNTFKVEITTYRKELKYHKRKPIQYLFIDSLKEDLYRRDFTINTICMDKEGKIIDLLNGRRDLDNKIIRCVGDVDNKLREDPLRILRALRFSAYLNFKLDPALERGIQKYKHLLRELSYERKKEEISYLIKWKRLDILNAYNLSEELELELDDIKYYNDDFLTWYTINPNWRYLFTHYEVKIARSLSALLASSFLPYDLYNAGLYVTSLASQLIDTRLLDQYNKLPIKKRQDINITVVELIKLYPSQKVGRLYHLLEEAILNGTLPNQKDAIMSYLENLKHTL